MDRTVGDLLQGSRQGSIQKGLGFRGLDDMSLQKVIYDLSLHGDIGLCRAM